MATPEVKQETGEAIRNIVDYAFLEPNDEATRNMITDKLYDYLNSNIQVQAFIVRCNEVNNTPEKIDACELHVTVEVIHLGDTGPTLYECKLGPALLEDSNDEADSN